MLIAVLSNYMVDIDWLLSCEFNSPQLCTLEKVIIMNIIAPILTYQKEKKNCCFYS